MEENERNEQIGDLAEAMMKSVPTLLRRLIRKDEKVDGTNLAFPKIGILMTLVREGPLPLSVIADRHSYSRQNLTTLTDQLEADGLVKRSPDVKDRRVINLDLTDAGIRYVAEKKRLTKDRLVRELENMDDADIEALHHSFETIERIYLKLAESQK